MKKNTKAILPVTFSNKIQKTLSRWFLYVGIITQAKYSLLNFFSAKIIVKVQKRPKSEISEMSISIEIHQIIFGIISASICS